MSDYEIIDAHVHLHRTLLQEKQSFPIAGRRDRDRWGNVDSVIAYMDREGVSKIVCLNLFPTEPVRKSLLSKLPANLSATERKATEQGVEKELTERLRRHNEWICEVGRQNSRIVPGIGMQKLFAPQQMVEELVLRVSQGAKAVKLLPGMFMHYPDDRAFWPLYEKCQELGIPVTSDTGTLGADSCGGLCYGQPIRFTQVLESFPRLKLVMCHLGSAFWDERVELAERYPNLSFDISGGFNPPEHTMHDSPLVARDGPRAIAEEDAVRVMRRVGIKRIMFGTDGPARMLQPSLEQILRLDLTEDERRMILAENAKRIYGI